MQVASGFPAAVVLVLVVALLLSGCGPKHDAPADGQVIGHVGPDDVTLQELQTELRARDVPADKLNDDATLKAALQDIVSRKYLVQQAVAAKLDRQPGILLEILRQREQVLANAYLQRQLQQKAGGVGKSDVDAFIQAHPSEFGSHEVFKVDRVSFFAPTEMDAIVAATKDFKTLEQVTSELDSRGVQHVRAPGTIDSTIFPEQVLSALMARKSDDIFFFRAGDGATYFKVVGVEMKPVTGDLAAQRAKYGIRMELMKSSAAQAKAAALATAKFEGDYARIIGSSKPAEPVPTQTPAPAQ
jgi:EpsD family peptidyl-prolyl cis-trans isomerase